MRILEINSIVKQDGWIYYMQRYSGTAVIELPGQQVSMPLSFSIETGPLGNKTIDIDELPNTLNYPVFPIMKSLKEFINNLSNQGSLP